MKSFLNNVMRRLLIIVSFLLFLPSCGRADKGGEADYAFYHWTGNNDHGPVELILAGRGDGLLAGYYHWTFEGSEYTSDVYGTRVDGSENNLLLSVYPSSGCSRLKSLPGEIMEDGSYKGWEIWDNQKYEMEISLQPSDAFPEDFENPLQHLKFKELKKFGEYVDIFTSPIYGECSKVLTFLTGRGGRISFDISADMGGDFSCGNLDYAKLQPESYVNFKDGFVEYTEGSFTCRIEFFKNFLYIERVSEFDASDPICLDSDKIMGFYPLQEISEEIPETWWEADCEEEWE